MRIPINAYGDTTMMMQHKQNELFKNRSLALKQHKAYLKRVKKQKGLDEFINSITNRKSLSPATDFQTSSVKQILPGAPLERNLIPVESEDGSESSSCHQHY